MVLGFLACSVKAHIKTVECSVSLIRVAADNRVSEKKEKKRNLSLDKMKDEQKPDEINCTGFFLPGCR